MHTSKLEPARNLAMRRFEWIVTLVAIGVCVSASLCKSADYGGMKSVAIVVDCSRSMGEPVVNDKGIAEGETRMDLALDVVQSTLSSLAEEGKYRVAIWLFGHRLAWETGSSEPGLQEQTAYLEQTLGFNVLSDLLPGDDVELMRPLTRLDRRDLPGIDMKLNSVQAWGEDPLYLALVKALDTFERNSTSQRSIIVVTDGGNHQGYCKFKTEHDRVLDTLEQKAIPIHFLVVPGSNLSRQGETELRLIADNGGGSFRKAIDGNDLVACLDDAIAGRLPGVIATTPAPAMTSVSATGDASRAAPKPQNVQGHVTCLSRAVGNTKVTLEGPGGAQSVTTNANGDFLFKNLAAGSYTVKCKTIIANVIREGSQTFTLDGAELLPVELIIR